MQDTSERLAQIHSFISTHIKSDFELAALPQDASFRRYWRVSSASGTYILMDAPIDKEDTMPFVKVDRHLEQLGLAVPHIHTSEQQLGFLLLEDFGSDTFTKLLKSGADEQALYLKATNTLIELNRNPHTSSIDVPHYDVNELMREALLLPDWYHQLLNGCNVEDEARLRYTSIWQQIIAALPQPAMTLVLRDFHVDNLMMVDRGGQQVCGLLDFQDAVIGPLPYDLMSLLQDARRDLSSATEEAMIQHYLACMPLLDQENFRLWYEVLAAQRHCKVLGIFSRLWLRDGKATYLGHLPRVTRLLDACLETPLLYPLRDWLDHYYPDRRQYKPLT